MAAVTGLGKQGVDAAISELLVAAKDPSPGVRSCAALALGMIRQTDRSAGALRALLDDPEDDGVFCRTGP